MSSWAPKRTVMGLPVVLLRMCHVAPLFVGRKTARSVSPSPSKSTTYLYAGSGLSESSLGESQPGS